MSLYVNGKAPPWYVCATCGARNVKLYRGYSQFRVDLTCARCTEIDQQLRRDPKHPHAIGWRVAAVPVDGATNRGDASWWGYTSVPEVGLVWWDSLASNHHGEQEALSPKDAKSGAS